jgi:predicted phage terminase large subunit-like protein
MESQTVARSTDYQAIYEQLPSELQSEVDALVDVDSKPLREFITDLVPHEPPPPHTKLLTDLIEQARRERIRVCLSWPPRHAKTVTLLRANAWWLGLYPADTNAYFSYSDTQAKSKSRLARRWAIRSGVELADDSKNMSEWRTTDGGGLIAGGAGGGLTGQGVSGLFIVDDPFKNRTEADSLLIRDRVWEWFKECVYTRLEGASVIVVHTRWHEDDLIGRLEDAGGWDVINLPAIAEAPDQIGRAAGEALWPDRFNTEELQDIRARIGEWSFAALYQGRPQPRGANVFGEPARFELPNTPEEWKEFLQGKYLMIGVDPAASEKTRADYSAAVVMASDGIGPTMTTWILRVIRVQQAIPAFVQTLRDLQAYWRCMLAIEAVAGFKALPQMLRHVDPNLRLLEIHPTTDKFQRSQGLAAAWNDGRVLVPIGEEWVDPYLQEMLSFSGVKDAHDDQVDGTAHGWNALANARPRRRERVRVADGPFG